MMMTSLFSKEKEKVVNKVVLIPTSEIVPNPAQPRLEFSEQELSSLAKSIEENGILQPITVRRNLKGQYELISGERRLKASRMARLDAVPCIVMETTEQQSAVLALLENIQRRDLNCFEEAKALAALMNEWNVTQEEAAARLGMAQSTIANKIRLLRLSESAAKTILDGNLTERHARALLKLKDSRSQEEAAQWAAKHQLNVVETEAYIESLLKKESEPQNKGKKFIIKDIRLFLNTINRAIDTMKQAGIPAKAEKIQQEDYIEYVVRIPL